MGREKVNNTQRKRRQVSEIRSRYVVFFFSSRRRHTRLVSDWSSDVCSSDRVQYGVSRFHSL